MTRDTLPLDCSRSDFRAWLERVYKTAKVPCRDQLWDLATEFGDPCGYSEVERIYERLVRLVASAGKGRDSDTRTGRLTITQPENDP
jgi:hypothetical protein